MNLPGGGGRGGGFNFHYNLTKIITCLTTAMSQQTCLHLFVLTNYTHLGLTTIQHTFFFQKVKNSKVHFKALFKRHFDILPFWVLFNFLLSNLPEHWCTRIQASDQVKKLQERLVAFYSHRTGTRICAVTRWVCFQTRQVNWRTATILPAQCHGNAPSVNLLRVWISL